LGRPASAADVRTLFAAPRLPLFDEATKTSAETSELLD
jgi:hypothetical protein